MEDGAGRLRGKTVLVVEDEYYLAADVAQLLKAAGAQVCGPFPDQAEAMSALDRGLADCAILDVNLGSGAGFELADRLRSLDVPFLFFTGYDPAMIPLRFSDVPRVEKPVSNAKLQAAIVKLVSAHRAAP